MTKRTKSLNLSRRQFVLASGGAAAALASPAFIRDLKAADEFKIAAFIALTGPASLFGPTQKACAELAVEQINAAGGINGREVKLIIADGGVAPGEAAKTAVRLMLRDKVDFFAGSHDSAVRQALVATFKGKTPYVYTPIYEGGECAPNTYVVADTPAQQIGTAIPWLYKKHGLKDCYLVGNDYVWPRVLNEHTKKAVAAAGGSIVGEEYVPLGAPNKFEEIVTRIKAKNPSFVMVTVIGAYNVVFNQTFASFGLDENITRLSALLEENTLLGIGKDNAKGLYGCMSYFESVASPDSEAFKKAYLAKMGDKAPQLSLIGTDIYAGINFAAEVTKKAGSTDAAAVAKAAVDLPFKSAVGTWVMRSNRHVDKTMYMGDASSGKLEVVETFKDVASGETCK